MEAILIEVTNTSLEENDVNVDALCMFKENDIDGPFWSHVKYVEALVGACLG